MNNLEFSSAFDTLINSYGEEGGVTFSEYEKSVFLTKAQEEIVVSLYSGKNTAGDSFEKTEELRRYLDVLIKTYKSVPFLAPKTLEGVLIGLNKKSVWIKLPENLWFITYETVDFDTTKNPKGLKCKTAEDITVVPITQDEYHKIKNNPFRNSNEYRVLRLDAGEITEGTETETEDNKVVISKVIELISKYPIANYYARYITKPSPIVLINLPTGLTIDGVSTESACNLHPALHRLILDRAIELALASKGINLKNK